MSRGLFKCDLCDTFTCSNCNMSEYEKICKECVNGKLRRAANILKRARDIPNFNSLSDYECFELYVSGLLNKKIKNGSFLRRLQSFVWGKFALI